MSGCQPNSKRAALIKPLWSSNTLPPADPDLRRTSSAVKNLKSIGRNRRSLKTDTVAFGYRLPRFIIELPAQQRPVCHIQRRQQTAEGLQYSCTARPYQQLGPQFSSQPPAPPTRLPRSRITISLTPAPTQATRPVGQMEREVRIQPVARPRLQAQTPPEEYQQAGQAPAEQAQHQLPEPRRSAAPRQEVQHLAAHLPQGAPITTGTWPKLFPPDGNTAAR